ncbi:uncharacterized protein FFMR_04124 [Fusarium fujikuroi]|nr:uncharacterized protein FFMR_04124 [Fusarium fujikuroi]
MPSRNCSILPNIGPFTARQVYDNLPLAQGSQYIRVLDVHKSDPADSDRLTGTLRTVDLRALPKFTALSYVWGQGSYHKIACNGCDINITQSCYEALTSLRESCQSLTVWVDAICINQEDTGEKEQQIMLMGRIYTLAEIVYVWLGVGNTKTDQAAEYIGAISQFRLFPAKAIRDRNSKWPHDRVYAIDSVLRQLGAKPPAPDCQKPLGQVYRDALVGLMEWNPTLITLLVDCGSHLPDDPSWVPDWSQNNKSWVPDSYIYHGAEKRPWNEQDLAQSVSGNILSVEAACLGMSDYCLTLEESEVDELRSNQVTTNGKLVHNVQLLAEWVLRIRNDILIFRLHDSVPWTIMLTLTGRPILRSEITSEQEDTFRRMYEIITQLGIEADSVPEDTAAVATAATRALEAICQSEGCSKLFLDTCNRIAGRRGLIVSDNGLIGSGPISIRQGDTISLIKGIPVPMALRKVGEDYQVLGPVFIDGFMGLPTETSGSMNLDWGDF